MPASTPPPYPTLRLPQIAVFNLLIFAWWLEVGLRVSLLAAIRFEFLLAATCIVMAVLHAQATPRPRIRPKAESNSDIIKCSVVFVIVLALSLPFALNFQIAWNSFFNRVVKLAIIGLLLPQFVVSPFTLRIYLFTTLLAFLKIGQEAFLGKVTGSMVWYNQGVPRLHGEPGTMFGHPNSLSGKTVSLLPWMWYIYPTVQRHWVKLLLILQLVFSINIIIFTGSRTGYLTVIAVALLTIALAKKYRGRLLIAFVAAAIATVIFVPQEYKDRFTSAFTGVEAEGKSADTRKALFFDSLQAFADNPIGVGISCFPLYQAIHKRNAQDTHNLYTQLLAETGLQGFLCFLALLYVVLRKAFRCRKVFMSLIGKLEQSAPSNPSDEAINSELRDVRLLLATTNALIVFTFTRLALGVFGHDLLEIYWWLAAGTAMALHNMRLVAERRCEVLLQKNASGADLALSHTVRHERYKSPRYPLQRKL
jgi:putative inorganic carbon (HCO3(-)) transporter